MRQRHWPYTKFYYFVEQYPDNLFITVDDDIIYPSDFVDSLIRAYEDTPDIIYCHRAHRIKTDTQGNVLPYKHWEWNINDSQADLRVFPTGVGGVLYFPGCFDEDILNRENFLNLAPGADDIWLKAMSLKKGIKCQHVNDLREWRSRFIQVSNSQMVKLKRQNKAAKTGNDAKIQAVFNHYGLHSSLQA